jgi:tetratricopeptide (TPR) repeat protein
MRFQSFSIICISLCAWALCACDSKPSTSSASAPAAQAAKPKAAPVILKDEAKRELLTNTAIEWAKNISDGQPEAVVNVFKIEVLIATMVSQLEVEPKIRQDIEMGIKRALPQLRKNMAVQWKGVAKFLRLVDTEDGTVARMRIVSDGGSSYLDFIPLFEKDDKISILDLNNRSVGTRVSDAMKQVLSTMIQSMPKQQGLLAKILGGSDASDEDNKMVIEYVESMKANKKHAVSLYPKLPVSVRKNRAFFATYLQAAISLDDEKIYMKAMEEGRMRFPNDPALAFMMVDFHYLKKDFAEAEKSVMTTMAALGEDGNLWHLCSSMRREGGNLEAADEAYHKAIELEPEIFNHHVVGLQVAAQRKDYKEVVRRLKLASDGVGEVMVLQPSGDPFLDEAIKSEEYLTYESKVTK